MKVLNPIKDSHANPLCALWLKNLRVLCVFAVKL